MDTNIRDMLAFDPLDTAERIVGGRSDDATRLGMALAIGHNQAKRGMLLAMDDTTLKQDFDAVLLTGGAGWARDLKVPGRDLSGIHFAMEFLNIAERNFT